MLKPQYVYIAEEIASRASNKLKDSVTYKHIEKLGVVQFTTVNSNLSTSIPTEAFNISTGEEMSRFVITRIEGMLLDAQ